MSKQRLTREQIEAAKAKGAAIYERFREEYIGQVEEQFRMARADAVRFEAALQVANNRADRAEKAAVLAAMPLEVMVATGSTRDFCQSLKDGVTEGIKAVREMAAAKQETP